MNFLQISFQRNIIMQRITLKMMHARTFLHLSVSICVQHLIRHCKPYEMYCLISSGIFMLTLPSNLVWIQIWVPSNPRGAERLPPGIVESESDFYLRRLWGKPSEVSTHHKSLFPTSCRFVLFLSKCSPRFEWPIFRRSF